MLIPLRWVSTEERSPKAPCLQKKKCPDVLVFVSQIRCGALPVTSDGFIPVCARSKLITLITCQQRLQACWLGSLVWRACAGLRDGLSLSAFVCKAKQTFLLPPVLQEGTSNIALSVFSNQFLLLDRPTASWVNFSLQSQR